MLLASYFIISSAAERLERDEAERLAAGQV
jgi:hypothetical protein